MSNILSFSYPIWNKYSMLNNLSPSYMLHCHHSLIYTCIIHLFAKESTQMNWICHSYQYQRGLWSRQIMLLCHKRMPHTCFYQAPKQSNMHKGIMAIHISATVIWAPTFLNYDAMVFWSKHQSWIKFCWVVIMTGRKDMVSSKFTLTEFG